MMHKLKHIRYIEYVIIIFIMLSFTVITQGISINPKENPIGNSGSLNDNHIVLSMDFENNWISNSFSTYAAPDNWVIQGICKGFRENNNQLTHYWSQINRDFIYTHTFWESSFVKDPFVYSGNYAASIWGNDGYMANYFLHISSCILLRLTVDRLREGGQTRMGVYNPYIQHSPSLRYRQDISLVDYWYIYTPG